MTTYNTIDQIPKSGSGYDNLSFYSQNVKFWEFYNYTTGQWVKRHGYRIPSGDTVRNVVDGGKQYFVRYDDANGDEHRASLEAFMQRDFMQDVRIENLPDGYETYVQQSGTRTPSNFITTQELGGDTAGDYRSQVEQEKQDYIDSVDGEPSTRLVAGQTEEKTADMQARDYVYGSDVLGAKANNAAVNTLYNAYFGRNATQAELDNWGDSGGADTTVRALEEFLQKERVKYNYNEPVKTLEEITGQTGTSITPGGAQTASQSLMDLSVNLANFPQEILNSEEYQSLNADQQSLLLTQWLAMKADDEETRAQAQQALTQAMEIVDPYSKIQIAFALNGIPDQFRVEKQTIEDKLSTIKESMAEIGNLMEDATIEEQQTLKSIAREYEKQQLNIEDQMAEGGLTYSSKRSDAERYLSQQNADMRESTRRSFNQRSRNYEQNKAELERNLKLTQEAGEAQLKALAAGVEAKLGTSDFKKLGLTGLSGEKIGAVTGKGDVPEYGGDIEQQRQASILNLAQQIQQFKSPDTLSSLFNL